MSTKRVKNQQEMLASILASLNAVQDALLLLDTRYFRDEANVLGEVIDTIEVTIERNGLELWRRSMNE